MFGRLHLRAVDHLIECREYGDRVLLAVSADGIEMLQPESDWVDETVARGARLIGQVNAKPLAVRHRLLVGERRQHRIYARGRRGNDLTQKVLAHEDASLGGRR